MTRVGISFMVKGGVSYRCDKGAQRLREKLADGKVAVQPSDYPLSLFLLLSFSSPSIPGLLHLSCCPFLPAVPYVLFSLTYSLPPPRLLCDFLAFSLSPSFISPSYLFAFGVEAGTDYNLY